MRTVQSVVDKISPRNHRPLPPPVYEPPQRSSLNVGLAVESMKRHMSDEGWQVFESLKLAGWMLVGHNIDESVRLPYDPKVCGAPLVHTSNLTDVRDLLCLGPTTVLMQDEREWNVESGNFRDPRAKFRYVEQLANRPDVFKLTIHKDAHQRPDFHSESAAKIGCHAWICYYNPDIVLKYAPFIRREHLIRVYHTIDPTLVPVYSKNRQGCLLSGATSAAYPLRSRLFKESNLIPDCTALRHPGYHRHGPDNPKFMETLSRYKVAICTSSIHAYTLRKFAEATACGCVVVTDLPVDEVVPEIDDNLIRVDPEASTKEIAEVVAQAEAGYNEDRQQEFSEKAKRRFDYRRCGFWLANQIETMRKNYNLKKEVWS
jgi:hypothetical protein